MTMTSLQIRLGGHLDAESWARRHAAGQVPDRWPYGLDRLAGHGFALSAADPYQGGTVGRQAARVARGLGHYEWLETARMESQAAGAELCVCWDERIGVPSALLGRVPVATGVIALTDRGAAQRRVAGAALRRAHQVWALSTAQLPLLRDEAGVPAGRLHHLLFGIDCDFFTPGDAQPRPGLVASAGNDQHRDHATVVRAMALVRRRVPDARLEIATHHPIEVPADLGIRHPQLSHGDLRELYRRSQVVVVALHPNLHVSGVTVALEAMACGRPVVITGTPGMTDYVVHGEWGRLVPPGDPEALARAIIDLLLDQDEAAALGGAGHKAAQDRYNTASQAAALAELLRG